MAQPKWLQGKVDSDTIKTLPIAFRPINKDTDINFVLNSWTKGQRENWHATMRDPDLYYKVIEQYIRDLIDRVGCTIIYDPQDPDTIYGYCCFEYLGTQLIIHYMYMKQPFRQFGIMTYLYKKINKDDQIPIISSWSDMLYYIIQKGHNVLYDPFIIHKILKLRG